MKKSIYSNNYKYLLKLLIMTRKIKNVTQKDIADKLEYPQCIISRIETGERRIDVVEFIEIANAIGCDPLTLLEELIKNWEV